MNAIGQDLHGKQIVIQEGYRTLSVQKAPRTGHTLVLCVPRLFAGPGAEAGATAHLLFGTWLLDAQPVVVDGRDVARLATDDDIEAIRILQREMEANAIETAK